MITMNKNDIEDFNKGMLDALAGKSRKLKEGVIVEGITQIPMLSCVFCHLPLLFDESTLSFYTVSDEQGYYFDLAQTILQNDFRMHIYVEIKDYLQARMDTEIARRGTYYELSEFPNPLIFIKDYVDFKNFTLNRSIALTLQGLEE